MKIRRKSITKFIRILLSISGGFFILLCILAFTTLPYHVLHWLGTHEGCTNKTPSCIVLLGGSGMPSEDGLIRCYYTSHLGKKYKDASIIIALPGDTIDSLSSVSQFKTELILRGIDAGRIQFESSGHNTRQQAMLIAGGSGKKFLNTPLALVTSPDHMYRSIRSFRKVGFTDVMGSPTFEISIDEKDLYFQDRQLKGNRLVPPIGQNKQIRYQFWNHLKYEISVFREIFAIAYYKLRNWI